MSRYTKHVVAEEKNANARFQQVPTTGEWEIAYGKDRMTAMAHFVQFFPIDEAAKSQCKVNYDGTEYNDDGSVIEGSTLPAEKWDWNPIDFDCMFTRAIDGTRFNGTDWLDILRSFGIKG